MVELDQWIDEALPAYAGEPPAGLPERVLTRVRRGYWPMGGWAALAAAAALVLLFVRVPGRPALTPPPLVAAAIPSPVLTPVGAAAAPVRVRRAPPVVPVARPAELTPEERRLALFAVAYPALAEQVFVEAPKRMSEPITIAPLTIEPLEVTLGELPK